MEYFDIRPKEPEHIALAFSGGGFRAATYALGCLSYMETVKTGEKKFTGLVNFIASASGGTITNLLYTVSQRKGQSFDHFYSNMNEEVLKDNKLVKRVFEILQDMGCWSERPEKSRNLINAFAMAYDELLFHGEQFGIFWKSIPGVVEEVCANTTEFDNGMLFRFQNAGIAGNRFLAFRNSEEGRKILKLVKLGDILAASSCFPVGFEPVMFPVDFVHGGMKKEELEQAVRQGSRYTPAREESFDNTPVSFGLMDGGIDDNQAIDSFILAENRMESSNSFGYDLFMTCDVSSNYTSGFDFPVENKRNFFLRASLIPYTVLILLLLILSIACIEFNILPMLSFMMFGISIFLTALIGLLFLKGWSAARRARLEKNTFGILLFQYLPVFLRLRLSVLLQMVAARALSAGQLASVVFMKKIRRISYDRIFEKISELKFKADGNLLKEKEDESLVVRTGLKRWSDFTIQNALYLLSKKNDHQRIKDLKGEDWFEKNPEVFIDGNLKNLMELMQPSPKLQEVADKATEMDTTLWFDENHIKENRPASLIAAGQFTTCYNLLRYSFRFQSTPYWKRIQENLAKDWERFNRDPMWMYDTFSKQH